MLAAVAGGRMTGRQATQVLNGPSSRGVRQALASVLAGARLPAPPPVETTPASQFAACPQCGSALRFPTEQATGRLFEHCDHCGFHRVMPRQTAAAVQAQERARFAALVADEARDPLARDPVTVRHCARCGAALPPKRVGVRGPRFCKDRKRCLRAAEGKRPRPIAPAVALPALCARVAHALPGARLGALTVPELERRLSLTTAQVRRALVTLEREDRARSAWLDERKGRTGGRPPKGYWSTRP